MEIYSNLLCEEVEECTWYGTPEVKEQLQEQRAQSCKARGVSLEKRGLSRENHGKLKPTAFLTRN